MVLAAPVVSCLSLAKPTDKKALTKGKATKPVKPKATAKAAAAKPKAAKASGPKTVARRAVKATPKSMTKPKRRAAKP